MSSESPSDAAAGPQPVSPATQRRLQQCFAHATRNSKKGDYNYANDMFTQCVVGDPGNLMYLQSFLGNLQRKYNNNKKGGKLASLKGAGAKASIKKATATKDWHGVIKAGCSMLAHNPWDSSTLAAMARACEQLQHDDCQLFYLKTALDAQPKDAEVNRLAALALERMGQFDQAIACWHRVEQARPGDEEAQRMIGNLSISKTIQQGGYEERIASGEETVGGTVAAESPATAPPLTPEQKFNHAIARAPQEIGNYLELADLRVRDGRLDEAEDCLVQAQRIAGADDLAVRERLEDVRLQRGRQQVEGAEHRAATERTEQAAAQLKRVRAEVNQAELEIYRARCARSPNNPALHYELGNRLKQAGQFNEAIQQLQAARADAKHKAAVLIELGECFHCIKQYKLALTHYVQAVEASSPRDPGPRKLALYRAGKLAMGLKDLDAAEKYLTELAGLDFAYRDIAACLDKLTQLRHNT